MPIFVTENGVSSRDSDMINPLEDLDTRGWVYENNINQIMRAVVQDGVEVIGYAAWSLMDNYEWGNGYAERFGIHYINLTSPYGSTGSGERIPKQSAAIVEKIFRSNGYPDGVSTTTTPATISTTTVEIKTETNVITETTSGQSKLFFNLVLAILIFTK